MEYSKKGIDICYTNQKVVMELSKFYQSLTLGAYMESNYKNLHDFLEVVLVGNIESMTSKLECITIQYSVLTDLDQLKIFLSDLTDDEFNNFFKNFKKLQLSYEEVLKVSSDTESEFEKLQEVQQNILNVDTSSIESEVHSNDDDSNFLSNVFSEFNDKVVISIRKNNLINFRHIIIEEKTNRDYTNLLNNKINIFEQKLEAINEKFDSKIAVLDDKIEKLNEQQLNNNKILYILTCIVVMILINIIGNLEDTPNIIKNISNQLVTYVVITGVASFYAKFKKN